MKEQGHSPFWCMRVGCYFVLQADHKKIDCRALEEKNQRQLRNDN